MGRIGPAILLLAVTLAGGPAAAQNVLLLHDAGEDPGGAEQRLIASALDLLGHFGGDVAVCSAQSYEPQQLAAYDVAVYLGLRDGAVLPQALLADCYDLDRTICWLGANFDQLAMRYSLGRYGFEIGGLSPEPAPTRVTYEGMPYWRPEGPLRRITCARPDVCTVLATAERAADRRPYAVRSGRLWYFPELPLARARKLGTHLILCDQMHDVLDQPHEDRRLASVVVRGASPSTDSGRLSGLLRRLHRAGVPFAIEVQALEPTTAPGQLMRLSRKRGLVGVLRGAQREGATIVASAPYWVRPEGQQGPVLALNAGPDAKEDAPRLSAPLVEVVEELSRCGLYPAAWAVPRAVLTEEEAVELARLCSTVLDRSAAGEEDGMPPAMPFLIGRDAWGQIVMPDNLPLLTEGRGEVEVILETARRQAAVADSWVTAGIDAGAPLEAVPLLINGLRNMGYEFANLRHMPNWTKHDSLKIQTVSSQQLLTDVLPDAWDATLIGPEPGARERFEGPDVERREETIVQPGAILVAYPRGARPKIVFSFEGDPQQVTQRAAYRIAHCVVLFAVGASVILLLIYVVQVAQRRSVLR